MPTKINYGDFAANTVAGCTKLSAGCENCWSCRISATRLKHHPLYEAVSKVETETSWKTNRPVAFKCYRWTGNIKLDLTPLRKTLTMRKPRRVLVNFTGDTFHEKIVYDQLDEMFAVMALGTQHTYLVLTKRAERMMHYFNMPDDNGDIIECPPPPNVWLGVSVENQAAADERIPRLMNTPAAVKWVSLEPLLSKVDMTPYLTGLDLVLLGCESGPNRRPCEIQWIESIVEQCDAAGVPCFIKQMEIGNKVVHDVNRFPQQLQRRELL